jgi:uncharacterized membrane protein (UPF0127 family)
MKFPIDVLFLNKKRRVLKIRAAMPRWRMALCLWAHSVLELPSGMAEATGTSAGDQLEFETYEG